MSQELKMKVIYAKTGISKYISHLDCIDIICKALRMLQLPYQVTQGCHVRPKITFAPPLPLGHCSYCEYFILSLEKNIEIQKLKQSLSQNLPEGMYVTEILFPFEQKKASNNGQIAEYKLTFSNQATADKAFNWLNCPQTSFCATHKGRVREYTLNNAVKQINLSDDKGQIHAHFIQAVANTPSVSRIVSGLTEMLKDERHNLVTIERLALKDL